MSEEKFGHWTKLPIDTIDEVVSAEPSVECPRTEILELLKDLRMAAETRDYIPYTPTLLNPSLSDDYIFNEEDEIYILKDLEEDNLVAKIKDLGKGAQKRLKRGLPQEYLYVFKYLCKLRRRDADESGIDEENVLIYIKINNRKIPYKKVFIISFHKNRAN